MAFASAAGHGNLPNGNFSPVIYSRKAQLAFRRASVIQAISNTDYFGEISDYGDTVKILKEPQLYVTPYTRGKQVQTQDLPDEEFSLTIDQANYFAFKVDDLEKKQSHVNWESMASDQAGYRLKDAMDSEVLTYLTNNLKTANIVGNSTPKTIGFASNDFTPLGAMNRLKRLMTQNDVPMENVWFIADPVFWELMEDEDSKLLNDDYAEKGILRNGRVVSGQIRGFDPYMSNNLPTAGTGPEGSGGSNYGWIIAGHMSSLATAEQISKTERYRDPDSFADVVRGLHYYGRKLLRPDAVYAMKWNYGA